MQIKQIHNSLIARMLGMNITLYPFVLYISVPSEITIRHEMIHIKQIEAVGLFKFYTSYIWHYVKNRFCGMNHINAYKNIPYEIEAYAKESES